MGPCSRVFYVACKLALASLGVKRARYDSPGPTCADDATNDEWPLVKIRLDSLINKKHSRGAQSSVELIYCGEY